MEREDTARREHQRRAVGPPVASPRAWTPAAVLALQRSGAGNGAIARALDARRTLARVHVLRLQTGTNTYALEDVPPGTIVATDRRVIRMSDCEVRVQNPKNTGRGGNPDEPWRSRVPDLSFNAKKKDVDATLGDFNNAGGDNIKLWNSGDHALAYAGLVQSPHDRTEPQVGLNDPASILTVLLPSANLKKVSGSTEATTNVYGTVLAHGLKGTITEADRLWIPARLVMDSLRRPTVEGFPRAGFMQFQLLDGSMIVLSLRT